jgi:hypothetical protein
MEGHLGSKADQTMTAHAMNIVLLVLWGLLCAKLCWNVMKPFALRHRSDRLGLPEGISLVPVVEAALLVALVIASALSTGERWWNSSLWTAGAGLDSIILSYLLMIVSGAMAHRRR